MAPGLTYTEAPPSDIGMSEHLDRVGVVDDGSVVEPIAVVGLSLKFPQEATSPEAFWKMLLEKRCAMTEIPPDRMNVDAFHGVDQSRTDTAGFLHHARKTENANIRIDHTPWRPFYQRGPHAL